MESKREIRKRIMAQVRRLSAEEKAIASDELTRQVLSLPAYQQAHTLMAFVSMPAEPDTREIIREAVRQGKTVLLPRCGPAPEMEALPWRGEDFLKPGPWGILEPIPEKNPEELSLPEPELILVPCVAATRDGGRLGHGAGYYDWFLRQRKAFTACLCFASQLVESLPMEFHDVRMDRVLWA